VPSTDAGSAPRDHAGVAPGGQVGRQGRGRPLHHPGPVLSSERGGSGSGLDSVDGRPAALTALRRVRKSMRFRLRGCYPLWRKCSTSFGRARNFNCDFPPNFQGSSKVLRTPQNTRCSADHFTPSPVNLIPGSSFVFFFSLSCHHSQDEYNFVCTKPFSFQNRQQEKCSFSHF
jgi:hypothetical protein